MLLVAKLWSARRLWWTDTANECLDGAALMSLFSQLIHAVSQAFDLFNGLDLNSPMSHPSPVRHRQTRESAQSALIEGPCRLNSHSSLASPIQAISRQAESRFDKYAPERCSENWRFMFIAFSLSLSHPDTSDTKQGCCQNQQHPEGRATTSSSYKL